MSGVRGGHARLPLGEVMAEHGRRGRSFALHSWAAAAWTCWKSPPSPRGVGRGQVGSVLGVGGVKEPTAVTLRTPSELLLLRRAEDDEENKTEN